MTAFDTGFTGIFNNKNNFCNVDRLIYTCKISQRLFVNLLIFKYCQLKYLLVKRNFPICPQNYNLNRFNRYLRYIPINYRLFCILCTGKFTTTSFFAFIFFNHILLIKKNESAHIYSIQIQFDSTLKTFHSSRLMIFMMPT